MSSALKSRTSTSSKRTQKSAGSAGAQTFPTFSSESNEMPESQGSEEIPDTSGETPCLIADTDPSRQTYPPQTPGEKSFGMPAGGGGSGGKSSRGPSTRRELSGSKSIAEILLPLFYSVHS